MSFIKSLKSAFGFSDPETEEAELEGIDATVVPLKSRGEAIPADSPYHPSAPDTTVEADGAAVASEPADTSDAAPEAVPSAIFDSVVKVFNEALPEFLRDSMNREAQCEYLYRQLDDSMKLYLEKVAAETRSRMNDRWEAERRSLQAQMSTLRAKVQKDEEESAETKKLHLSAERQKRALGERVRDLETQLQKAEAENEQLSLENKSMANKLRVSSVLGSEVPDADLEAAKALAMKVNELTAALESANTALDEARQQAVEARTLADSRQADLAAAENARSKAESEADRLGDALAKEKALRLDCEGRIESMEKALDESRVKDDLGDAMLTDINSKLGTTKAALEAAENRCRELEADNNKVNAEYERQKAELAQAMENLAVVEQMQVQLAQLEDARKNNEIFVKKKKEELLKASERLHQLELENEEQKHILGQKDATIHHLEDLTDSLRKTIETNLYEHAQSESGLRAEIQRLKKFKGLDREEASAEDVGGELGSGLSNAPAMKPKDVQRKPAQKDSGKQARVSISAIDESLEDTDWLVASPAEAKGASAEREPETDFGYKAPERKKTPDNPDQMLLF